MARKKQNIESHMVAQKQAIAKLQENVKLGDKRLGSDDILDPSGSRGLRRRMADSSQTLWAIFPPTGPSIKLGVFPELILRIVRTTWYAFRRFVLGSSAEHPQQTTENWLPPGSVLLPANEDLKEAWRKQYEKVKEDVECLRAQTQKRRTSIGQKDEQIGLLSQRKENARQLATPAPKSLLQKIWIFVCIWQLDVFRDSPVLEPDVEIVTLKDVLNRALPSLVNTEDVNSRLVKIGDQYREHGKHLDRIIGGLGI